MNTACIAMAGVALGLGLGGCATEAPPAMVSLPSGPLPSPVTPQSAIDPRRPQPRPQLVGVPQVRPAIRTDNQLGTSNLGLTGMDAKWSNYGAYLQRLIDTVDMRWNDILVQTKTYPPPGTDAIVTFILDSGGRIFRIVKVEGSTSNAGKQACVNAITDRAPYGLWTDDMKASLGGTQQMTFRFYFQ